MDEAVKFDWIHEQDWCELKYVKGLAETVERLGFVNNFTFEANYYEEEGRDCRCGSCSTTHRSLEVFMVDVHSVCICDYYDDWEVGL